MSAVTPTIKFENSPTESTVSLPGQTFSPLFPPSTELPTPAQETSDPMDQCSPESESDSDERPPEDVVLAALAASLSAGDIASVVAASTTGGNDDASGTDKKPVKKRKSWGQVLPEPKTNLPPRKRAKTADEKEQRRVERVLRNRRAAQSSRERKRLEVEALERRNKELETRINLVERANMILIDELNKARKAGGSSAPSPSLEALISSNTVAITSDLFMSQQAPLEQLLSASSDATTIPTVEENTRISTSTVDPASLSPQTTPVAESAKAATPSSKEFQKQQVKIEPVESVMALPATSSKSANMTQRPAEMLCDLQCQSAGLSLPRKASQTPTTQAFPAALLRNLLTASSALLSVCRRPLTQIAMSLRTGFPLPPTPSILTAIVWLVTRPSTRTSTTSTTSSSWTKDVLLTQQPKSLDSQRTQSSRSRFRSVRIKTLRKILTCSPSLARPLQDATMAVLRLVTKRTSDVSTLELDMPSHVQRESQAALLGGWRNSSSLPSKEALLTLLWMLRLEEKRLQRDLVLQAASNEARPESIVVSANSSNHTAVSSAAAPSMA
ncbi:Transcriptional activator hac1 [Ceratocystis fimbriata CBS 114723]|uniref:Transcriptional activator hac1 n=1 Tax=Ceratocystis fimbriata CBS 114723 TaxID=1035309 RepID=A0A2C5X088_9PEZI|nr:Transcriptional activator hac1 [Ceratocystis fimbriata CBS 114723]